MNPTHFKEAVLLLSFLAGAVHVITPDHWLPASIIAWKRGWTLRKTAFFALLCLLAHVALGVGAYFTFEIFLQKIEPAKLFSWSVLFITFTMLIRWIRFSRLEEVMSSQPSSQWGLFSVLGLLGPAESIIPILLKSSQLGLGFSTPSLAYIVGSICIGIPLIISGRLLWNRPLYLPRGLEWAGKRVAVLPVLVGLVLGIGAIVEVTRF